MKLGEDQDTPTPATVAHFNLSGGHVWDYRIGVGLARLSSPAFHTARQQDNKEETPVTLMTELQYRTERSLFANTEIGETWKLTVSVRITLQRRAVNCGSNARQG
jgi:hypothetical protein